MRRGILWIGLVAALFIAPLAAGGSTEIKIQEFVVPSGVLDEVRSEWLTGKLETNQPGTWAPLTFNPTDRQLEKLGLPPKEVLTKQRYPVPTMVDKMGNTTPVDLPSVTTQAGTLGPTVATFAGAGWFGIRPGAFLLLMDGGGLGWCSMAHVFGSPGTYKISTAGHCGRTGELATVIAGFGNQNGILNPILLDFGRFSSSVDNGLGSDFAVISVSSQWQSLVTPTMAFWGGPRGVFTKTGATVAVNIPRNAVVPGVTSNSDPLLPQTIVHYGHGTGIGSGGTPRVGEVIHWGSSHFMFFGAITPGDSGSGANTLLGDTVGANMEAAGILTHLWIDSYLRSGVGIMGGTRTTRIGTSADGQIVPYPIPLSALP